MGRSLGQWVLKCGDHVLGKVTHDGGENWHNYGHLTPGADLDQYRSLFDQWLRLDQLCDAISDEYRRMDRLDAPASDEHHRIGQLFEAAFEERDATEVEIDRLGLRLERLDSSGVTPIHNFHLTSADGEVYWRFTHEHELTPLRERIRGYALVLPVMAIVLPLVPFAAVYIFARWLCGHCSRIMRIIFRRKGAKARPIVKTKWG